ncbi:MAG TPA: hypothetical protein VFU82_08315 [Gammaproteobacteria bacterium]|jgi:hypothetical protein|nr:hypothetical protein [Gammaproteobacteria bacterium]
MKKIIAQLAATFAIFCALINTTQAATTLKGYLEKGWQAEAATDLAWIMGEKKPFPQAHYGIDQLIIGTNDGEVTAKATLDLVSNQPNETVFKLKLFPTYINKFKKDQPEPTYSTSLQGNILFNNNQNSCLIVGKTVHDSPTTAHLILDKRKSTCLIQINYKVDIVCDSLLLTALENIPVTIT